MADQSIDQMISNTTGSSAPSMTGQPDTVSTGTDTPTPAPQPAPQTAPSTPASPAAAADAQSNQSIDQMISNVTGGQSAPDITGMSNSSGSQSDQSQSTPPPSTAGSDGVVSRFTKPFSEDSGFAGVKAQTEADYQSNKRALDHYHEAIEAYQKGDNRAAAEAATKFMMVAGKQGLTKIFSPQISAMQALLLDPIKAVQEQRKLNQKTLAENNGDNSAQVRAVWDKAKNDWKTGNVLGAGTDLLNEVAGQPGIEAIPFVGGQVKKVANQLDTEMHRTNPDGTLNRDFAGAAGTVLGTGAPIVAGEAMSKIGGAAPAANEAAEGLNIGQAGADSAETAANVAKQHDDMLQANQDKFKQQLEDTKAAATSNKENAADAISDSKTNVKSNNAADQSQQRDAIKRDAASKAESIDQNLEDAKKDYGDQFQQTLNTNTAGAADPEELAGQVNEAINAYQKKAHTDFEEGINGENGLVTRLDGVYEPVTGSPLQKAAQEAVKAPVPGDHYLRKQTKGLAGIKLDPKLQKHIEDLSQGMMDVEVPGPADEAGKPTTQVIQKPMEDLTAEQLVGMRQDLRLARGEFLSNDINHKVYGKLIKAVDDTIQGMADKASDPSIKTNYDNLRANYREAMRNLDSSTADKLRLDSPDKAMDDVNDWLLKGNNSAAKISTISKIGGEEMMQGLRQSYLSKLGQMAPEDAMAELGKLNPATRQSFLGPELDGKLQAAQSLYDKSVSSASDAAEAAKQSASAQAEQQAQATRSREKFDNEGVDYQSREAKQKLSADTKDVIQKATDYFNRQNKPFTTAFATAIRNGKINEALAKGTIALSDVTELKSALSPREWGTIQTNLWTRALRDASLDNGRFVPSRFTNWYKNLDPEVRGQIFDLPEHADAAAKISDAADQQKLVQAGLATAATVATGGGIKLIPHSLFANLVEGAAVGATVKSGMLRTLIDYATSSPKLIKTMGAITNTLPVAGAGLRVAGAASKVAPFVKQPSQ